VAAETRPLLAALQTQLKDAAENPYPKPSPRTFEKSRVGISRPWRTRRSGRGGDARESVRRIKTSGSTRPASRSIRTLREAERARRAGSSKRSEPAAGSDAKLESLGGTVGTKQDEVLAVNGSGCGNPRRKRPRKNSALAGTDGPAHGGRGRRASCRWIRRRGSWEIRLPPRQRPEKRAGAHAWKPTLLRSARAGRKDGCDDRGELARAHPSKFQEQRAATLLAEQQLQQPDRHAGKHAFEKSRRKRRALWGTAARRRSKRNPPGARP